MDIFLDIKCFELDITLLIYIFILGICTMLQHMHWWAGPQNLINEKAIRIPNIAYAWQRNNS